jgi:hypothetical protein
MLSQDIYTVISVHIVQKSIFSYFLRIQKEKGPVSAYHSKVTGGDSLCFLLLYSIYFFLRSSPIPRCLHRPVVFV